MTSRERVGGLCGHASGGERQISMQSDNRFKEAGTAVIGAGITGLTAAFRLRQMGMPVAVFEASRRVGGVIETVREAGFLAECGPNTLLETSPVLGELFRDLEVESRRLYADPDMKNRYIVRDRKPRPLPLSPKEFFTCGLFSWKAKSRLLLEPFLRRAPADAEESLAEFVQRRLGQEFLDYAINPFVAGVYAGKPESLSVVHAFPKLHALEQKYGSLIRGQILGARERKRRGDVEKQKAKMVTFDAGLQVLTDTLGRRLAQDLRFERRITELRRNADGWHVHWESGDSEGPFADVVVATPAFQMAKLRLRNGGEETMPSMLAEVVYPPVASLVLGFRRDEVAHPLDGFGVLIPEKEGFHSLGAIFSSSLFPDRAPEGYVTLSCYIGGSRAPERAHESPDALVDHVLEDLRTLLGVTGSPVFVHHRTYEKAIPQYQVGYGRFKDYLGRLEKDYPGLHFAGHCRDGISLSDSIASGHNVADRIRHLRREFGEHPATSNP